MNVLKHCILIIDLCHIDKSELKEFLKNLDEAETQVCPVYMNWNKQEFLSDPDIKWLKADILASELDELSPLEVTILEAGKENLCDILHRIADELPVAGSIIDVVLDLTTVEDIDGSFLSLLHGVLKRYQLWLSANISILCPEHKANSYKNKDILLDVLSIHPLPNLIDVPIKQHAKWRGSLVFSDTQNGKDKLFPGFLLETTIKSSPINVDIKAETPEDNSQTNPTFEKISSVFKLGNLMKILDLVDVHTIPLFLIKPKLYKLSLQNSNPHSQNILQYFSSLEKIAMIVSVPRYKANSTIPTYSSMELGTSAWKECVMADLAQDAIPRYNHHNNDVDVMHMVLIHKDSASSIVDGQKVFSHSLQAYLLRSTSELSGQMMDVLHLAPRLYLNDEDLPEPLLSDLPVISGKMLHKMHTQLAKAQFTALKYCCETSSSHTSLSSQDLFQFLSLIQKEFIEKVQTKMPLIPSLPPFKRKFLTCNFGELDSQPLSWSERLYISQLESVKKAICRFRSFDSLSLSSPFIPSEETTPTEIDEILSHFLPNGNASCTSLSPLLSQHHLRSYVYPSVEEEFQTSLLDWPLCREARFPGVCYNKDGCSEKIQTRLNKIRDKFVSADTTTTCSIQGSLNPMMHSTSMAPLNTHRNTRDTTALRRKSEIGKLSRRSISDCTLMHSKASKKPDLPPTAVASSSRKRPSNQPQQMCDESKSKSRNSKKPGLYKSHSDTSTLTSIERERKMSRSERHRKKLEEIVQAVLKQEGVNEKDEIFTRCAQRLFKVTKLYVMDLPNSHNLSQDMKRIAEGQVKHVVELETRCQKSLKKRKLEN